MNDRYESILHQRFTLFPKIEYLKEVFEDPLDGRQCAYILLISRGAEVRIDTVMEPHGRFMLQAPSVSAQACKKPNEKLIGAINADFFNMTSGIPQGPVVMEGALIKEDMPDNTFFFGIRKDDTFVIGDRTVFLENKQALKMAVGGRHLLVDGDDFPEPMLEPKHDRHPRTGVGICKNGDLLLVVIEGRNPGASEGLQLERFARYFKHLGAEKALNLDGGGSSAMFVRMLGLQEIGMVNVPSDGCERVCANGIALFAQSKGDGICRSAYITPQQEYVAPGTRLQMNAYGLDSLLEPCALPDNAVFSVSEESGCAVSADGVFTAGMTEGDAEVSVYAGDRLLGTAMLHVRVPDALHAPDAFICPEGGAYELDVQAALKGRRVLTNPTSYCFRAPDEIGEFDEMGLFRAGNTACEGDVRVFAKNNGPDTVLHVRVGSLPQIIDVKPEEIETKGCTIACYHPLRFSSRRGQQVYLVEKQQPICEMRLTVHPYKKPNAVGMWVHRLEGKMPSFTLRVAGGAGISASVPFTPGEPTDSVWTYMEAPVSCDALQNSPMRLIISAVNNDLEKFAIDNFRLIYDYVDDDTLLPEINRISIKKYPPSYAEERIKITVYFGVGDLLPCYVPLDYKRLRILIDDKEYTGLTGHYGVNKGAASMMLHNMTVSKGIHRVSVCAQTLGGNQTWKDVIFDTDQLE